MLRLANQKVINKLIENGVKNLQEFGYPDANKDNILTDMVYAAFFKRMLNDAKGQGFDEEVNEILSKVSTELD